MKNTIKLIFMALLALAAAACDKTPQPEPEPKPEPKPEPEVVLNEDIKFTFEVVSVEVNTAKIKISHDGTSSDTWYGFATTNSNVTKAITEKHAELTAAGNIKGLRKQTSFTDTINELAPETEYTYIAFGVTADGTLYGDTKLYYATDVLKSVAWGNDAEASNLLSLDRAEDPEVQAIKLDIFRQIRLTVDNYLTKRAFADEGTFASFNSVMLGWMSETKKIYDGTLYNVFIGTTETNVGKQQVEIELDADNNSAGENIAKAMADLFTEMNDYTRDFNDYGYLRSYGDAEIKVICRVVAKADMIVSLVKHSTYHFKVNPPHSTRVLESLKERMISTRIGKYKNRKISAI